jgi:hypothetical protein
VSIQQLERWEFLLRTRGVAALAGVAGMTRCRVKTMDALLTMPIGALTNYTLDVLAILQQRLAQTVKRRA